MVRDIGRQGFKPTCTCNILIERSNPPDGREIKFRSLRDAQNIVDTIRSTNGLPRKIQFESILCPAHAPLGLTPEMFAVVLAENRIWNRTFSTIKGFMPKITVAQYVRATTAGIGQANYDADRILQVDTSHLPLTGTERTEFQDAVDLQFGPSKVLVI